MANRISKRIGSRTFTIRENRVGNWNGYISGKLVELFFSEDQPAAARAWLAAQEAAAAQAKAVA